MWTLVRLIVAATVGMAAAQSPVVSISFDGASVLNTVASSYLSVNLDSGSLCV